MSLFYNNINMDILLVRTRKQAIYDGPTYLYTRFLIQARCVYNPFATSYRLQPDTDGPQVSFQSDRKVVAAIPNALGGLRPPPAVPLGLIPLLTAGDGSPPAMTEKAIRHHLLQPRRLLIHEYGGIIILESPIRDTDHIRFGTDANNGPFPLECNVTSISGTKTFLVDFIIKTDINECIKFVDIKAEDLLSHRWEMMHDIDSNLFTTRTVVGHAIFRTDTLLKKNLTPDDFRILLFHPIPENFQRQHVHVKASSDGNALSYTYTDQQKGLSIVCANKHITRIEATHSCGMTAPGQEQAAINVARGIAEAIPWVGGSLRRALDYGIFQNVPTRRESINVKVWGDKESRRIDLETVAVGIAAFRFQLAQIQASSFNANLSYDLSGKFVSLDMSMIRGPLLEVVANIADLANRVAFGNVEFFDLAGQFQAALKQMSDFIPRPAIPDPDSESIPGFLSPGTYQQRKGQHPDFAVRANEQFAADNPTRLLAAKGELYDNASRSSYLEKVVAQALQDECERPAQPTGPPINGISNRRPPVRLPPLPPTEAAFLRIPVEVNVDDGVKMEDPLGEGDFERLPVPAPLQPPPAAPPANPQNPFGLIPIP